MTVLYTYFGQKERIPQIVEQGIKTMIVDDCSKEPLGSIDGIEVLRVIDDIKWNQPGARNLGFQELNGWVICLDIDHLLTRDIYDRLNSLYKEVGTVYYLGREDTKKSINVFMIHKDDFEKIGGYDEDFCGNYGYDDLHFHKKCSRFLNVVKLDDLKVKVYAKESSSNLERDAHINFTLYGRKMNLEKTKRIRFNWARV
jgi:hypothetical protein